MKLVSLTILFSLFNIGLTFSQCILPSGSYTWGLSDIDNYIVSNCGGDLSAGLILPTDAIISIQNNDVWDLTAYGAFTFTIQGNGSLSFNGSDQLNLAAGSVLIIENTSNTAALQVSGAGTNIRLTIGSTTYTGSQFASIIAAGGADQNGILPIELLSFSSSLNKDEQVELIWETLSEYNNSHFDIEHSSDGFNFENIGRVSGAGHSSNSRNYEFLHSLPNQGLNYYRLKQVDYDGNYEYLNTIVQELSSSTFFVLNYQTYSILSFKLKQPAQLLILDFSGRTINSSALQAGEQILNLSDLHKGKYLIRIHTNMEQKVIPIAR